MIDRPQPLLKLPARRMAIVRETLVEAAAPERIQLPSCARLLLPLTPAVPFQLNLARPGPQSSRSACDFRRLGGCALVLAGTEPLRLVCATAAPVVRS